jgi:type II secretory pathway pseudopilin PulG
MRFASTGSRVGSRSAIGKGRRKQAGFTLLEALVALGVVLMFTATLGPFMFQARRIMTNAEGRLAAQNLLRSLLDNPEQRPTLEDTLREGETAGLRWRLVAEPMTIDPRPLPERPKWIGYRVTATVSWGPRQLVTAETIRLGKQK